MHLGAHAVDVGRLYATQRILGVITVYWSLAAGGFLFAGGARRMSSSAWRPLMEFTHAVTGVPVDRAYLVAGAILIGAGVLGVLGLALTTRWISLASALIGALWCITVTGFLGFSNVSVDDGGNFLALSAFLNACLFVLRFYLLVKIPVPGRAVQLYERG